MEMDDVVVEVKEVEEVKLDWKAAAQKLKAIVEDTSIDNYFNQAEAKQLRDRYNSKERSEELFQKIMSL